MKLARAALALSAIVLVACAASEPPLVPASGPPPSSSGGCPLGVRGARVSGENTASGVIVTFMATTPQGIEDIRERVRNVAAQYGPGAHRGPGHDGEHDKSEHHGLHLSDMPPVQTSFQSIEGGARLHVLAIAEPDVRVVRERIYERLPQIAAGTCD